MFLTLFKENVDKYKNLLRKVEIGFPYNSHFKNDTTLLKTDTKQKNI